ncbi:retrotransposon protein, putative, ty1-copia subclass [Tanacetum coccineum]
MTSAREIWNSLEEKYTTEKEGADKFITFKFFEFSMEDNVSILDQVHEFLILVSKFKNLNIEIPEMVIAKDDACHHCKEVGHWKRNCPVYLAELLKKKKQVGSASSSGIFTIELFAFPNKSWVYDTGCDTHICITKQGFREARKLKQGALYLYVGNGVRAQVEAIGSFDLVLPNGLVICLDNCHYAPSITRGVVSVHRLVENGFVQRFTDFGISVSKNNVHYFNVIPSNGIYEIDMHNLVPNVNSIYNVSTKRAKHNLDSTYLWHCRLAHISKKRIEKLQHEGLLKSTDDESFDQCVSCLSGKMTRKSFPHRPERATDLLGIIHTDVCGPLRHVSKQGASYFITFTDDYSRYGYVYLLKHKHEVFETFKVFKNEVENQLGKTIKALRSDRGGEYISQEFKDYLKACGIVQQLTPPYTPQHNCLSERARNQFFLKNLITHEVSGRAIDLEEIQDEPISPSEITSEIPIEVEGFEPPQEEEIPICSVKDYLGKCFSMKDLGEATFILGIEIYRDRLKRLIGLSQNAYMDKILKRYRIDNFKRGHIPMQERFDLNITQGASTPEEVKRMKNVPYASAVRSIMYAVKCTRPDVAFTQNITSRFQQNPAALHFANEPGVQKGTRHYHRRYHYGRECIALREIRFLKVHTDDNLADPFTKALPKGKLTQHARSMGLRLASSFM